MFLILRRFLRAGAALVLIVLLAVGVIYTWPLGLDEGTAYPLSFGESTVLERYVAHSFGPEKHRGPADHELRRGRPAMLISVRSGVTGHRIGRAR